MKTKVLLIGVFILALLSFSGCQNSQPPQQPAPSSTAIETSTALVMPTATNTPPAATPPAATLPATATMPQPPTQAVEPSSTPTITPMPATDEPTAVISAATSAPTPTQADAAAALAGIQPQEGLWTGSATDGSTLLLTFRIAYTDGQPMLTEVSVLWFGSGDCSINLFVADATSIQPEEFKRFFTNDDMHYNLTGHIVSATQMQGEIILHPEGCGERTLRWIAAPKR